MRIVTWNACGAYRRKFQKIHALKPDIVIIAEAEQAFFKSRNLPYVWQGKDPSKKGVGIYALLDKANLLLAEAPKSKHMMPVILKLADQEFHILVVWSQKEEGSDYIAGMNKDMPKYKEFLAHPNSFVIGDWNSSVALDEKYGGEEVGHNALVRLLESWGLASAYHHWHDMDKHGDEAHPTFFHTKKLSRPFHIDYLFVPKNVAKKLKSVSVGAPQQWLELSDHMPLIIDFE